LLRQGFSEVTEGGIKKIGYSLDIQIVSRYESNASLILYMLTIGLFPFNKDIYENINVTYYKDGVLSKSVTYKSKVTLYGSIYFPTAFLMGNIHSKMLKKYSEYLSKKYFF